MVKIILLIFFMSLFFTSFPQSLKIKFGGGYNLLIKGKYIYLEDTPYEKSFDDVSFGTFYSPGFGFFMDLAFLFWSKPKEITTGFFFIGFNYEKSTIQSKHSEVKYILGESISQEKYTPYMAYGNFLDNENKYFTYAFFGVSLKNYTGTGKFPITDNFNYTHYTEAIYNFTDVLALRFGVGLDFEGISGSPFFGSLNSFYDWGVARRGDVETYLNGEKIILKPGGIKTIYDSTLYFNLTVGYKYNF